MSLPVVPNVALRREVHHGRVVTCFADRPAHVDALLRSAALRAPDAIAVVDGERRIRFADLDAAVDRVAAHFAALGLVAGDRIALLLDNRPEFLIATMASARIGAIVVPMNIRQRLPETLYALNDSGAALLIHEADLSAEIPRREDAPALRHRISRGGADDGWAGLEAPITPRTFEPPHEDAPFAILYTSGTTGRPKGAVLTHFGVIHSVKHFIHHLSLRDGDTTILAVPASHVTGLVIILLPVLALAGRVVMQRGFKARRFLELAAAEKLTFSMIVPAMYNLCLLDPEFDSFDLSSWRVGSFGGAPMPQSVVETLAAKLPGLMLHNVYGATETTSPAVIMPHGEGAHRLDAIGRPVLCCDLRIMDDAGREAAAGESGEIWMAGPMVIPGYWRNPVADADAFVGGYWRSGDIGSVDAEGYLRVFDRMKDMINRGGFKIYSVEVENVLAAYPGVIEAAVVGYPCPVLGERVAAFIRSETPIDADALRQYCAERLSDYKVPDRIQVSPDPLPRNPNGKLLKREMRDLIPDVAVQ